MKRHTRISRFLVTALLGLSLLSPISGILSTPPVAAEGPASPTPTPTPQGIECENEICT